MKSYIVIGFCLIAASNFRAPPLNSAEPLREFVEQEVDDFRQDKPYLGLVVGVIQADARDVFSFGNVNLGDASQPPDGSTLFEIGSITKVFTATLLAQSVVEGNLQLSDPVSQYLPEHLHPPQDARQPITLLSLATHRSRLPVQPPFLQFFAFAAGTPNNPYSRYTEQDLARTLKQLVPRDAVGSKYEYSNLGVGLLGHALAHASQADGFEEMIVTRICEPLKMSDTRVELTAELESRFAPGHSASGAVVSRWDFASLQAAGALRSTTDDMLRFAAANLGLEDTPLTTAFQLAHQRHGATTRDQLSLGLCWHRLQVEDELVLFHNGGTGGYSSLLALIPARKLGIVILSNSAHRVDPVGFEILKRLATGRE